MQRQRKWAAALEIDFDEGDHCASIEANLFQPLSPEAEEQLQASRLRPFGDADKPSPLAWLHSTVALCCNVFEPWRNASSLAPLSESLRADAGLMRWRLSAPIGEGASIAEADVLFEGEDARPTAIVAGHLEPYLGEGAPREGLPCDEDRRGWSMLPGCRNLALDLRANPRRRRRLPLARLLLLALSMTERFGVRGHRLLYLHTPCPGRPGRELEREIRHLRMRIGGEVDFAAMSWPALISAIAERAPEERRYSNYLRARYGGPMNGDPQDDEDRLPR